MPEMDAPRTLVFRPLVKGNEALGTRLHRSTWRGREREIGESEMNNLIERNQHPHVTKVTFYSYSDL